VIDRPRATRTGPAFAVVAVALVASGALLYDVIAVRTGHPARRWRAQLAHQLAIRHLDDTWVRTAAGIAALLGLVLLWLAFAPGMRHWLPLGRPGATIDRKAVATLIEAGAVRLPGVHGALVTVKRHHTKVIVSGPADPVAVHRALRAELARIPLAQPHRLEVLTRTTRPVPPDRHHLGAESGR
jgi:hypothetical protein